MANMPVQTKTASAVSKKLLEDHERLRVLMDKLKDELHEICHRQSNENLVNAKETAQKLLEEMNTHAACEEQALFTILGQSHPMPILEIEHEEVLLQRAALLSGILNYSFPEDCTDKLYKQAQEFFNLVERHMKKEEVSIFPLAEQVLTPAEKHMVLVKMDEIRATARVLPIQETQFPVKHYNLFHFPIGGSVDNEVHSESLLETKNLQFKLLQLKAGASLSTHWSPKQITILFYAGEAQWNGPDTTISLKAGDGLVMDPKLPHSLEAKTDCHFLLIANEV
jgi:hemerythrin-like domain-containing protein/quercetin dioxygenase-like cupin family protein